MFNRVVFQDSAAIFTIAAFIVAACVFVGVSWRAMRMKRAQVERFENLPFAPETPADRHERTDSA